ncbi:5924_t:CDS:2 [Gigaspora margarita]|uniref:5924_t:CDS:1 n=1 Tax=Gigaspora margarita TaxID=4874 RepID=A0ABM8W2R3_GIGMA|nr:5924_t:CDS:2 [Gigaspora margarita]
MERTLDDKRVTLSFLPNVEYDSTDVERLKTELISFEHENILKVFGLTYENMNYYIIREHANNGNMRDFLRNKHSSNYPLSWEEKQSLTYQVTKGLNFLHDNGIVHPELHPKNILMHNLTPKITNIGLSKFYTSNGLPFTPYSPPEYLNKYNTIDKTKLNIYSLGVLMWEISNNGIEPFYKKYDGIKLAVEIINCARELPIKGTPLKYIDIYKKCWDINSDERPCCSEILGELKNISYDQVYENSNDDDIFMNNDLPINTNETVIIKDCVLNFDELENQKKKNIQFINHFSLNKGRNPNWKVLNDFSVLSRSDNEAPFSDVEMMRINIPIGVVEQHNCTIGGAIIIDCSNINVKSVSRLQAYLKWGIDYAKGEMPTIFEDESLDGFPSFTTSPPRSMKTVKDLYSWLKDLHDYKDFGLISYEDYKPSYKLLNDGLKKQIVECFSLQPINKTPPVLIPQLPSEVEQKSFSEWLSLLKPSLLFYAYDWVKEFSLRYITLVQSSKLRQGLNITFKFLREPKITPINKISVLFAQPRTQKMADLLENNIAIKNADELNLNETSDNYFSLLYDPLEDSQHSNNPSLKKIWCQIKFPVAKISFDLSSIILSESCLDMVDESFENFQQYQNLSEVFKNHYGYLLPKTFIIGGILSKSYEQDYNSINIVNSQQIDFEEKDFCFQEKLEDFLTNLSEKYNIDTSLFFSDDKKGIKQNQIGCWYNTLKDNPDNWRIISLEDWRQIYNVDLNDNNYNIVFNGENSLIRDNQSELMIEFPRSLTNNDYHIYGSVIKMNKYKSWERVQETMVTFDHTDQHRCVALIHKSDNIRYETTKVLWFVLAKSEGYCTNNYKDMKVTYGKIETSGIPTNVNLKTKGIYTDSVLVTSFVPKQQKVISPYHIKIKHWSSNTVVLKVKKTNENYHEKVLLHWCMIDTNGKNLVNDNKESRPWNLYGNIFNEKSRKADTDPIYYGPSESSMIPEKANELYRKLNNDSRTILIENKHEKTPAVIKFTGYIKAAEVSHKEVNENNTQEISRYYKESADFGEEKQEVEKYFKSSINNQNSVILGGLLYSDEYLGYEDPENSSFGYRNFENRKFKRRNIENGKTWYIQIAIKKLLETKEPPGRRDRSQEIASNNDFALKIPFAIPHLFHSLFQIPEISYIHKYPTSNNENFDFLYHKMNENQERLFLSAMKFYGLDNHLVDYEKFETYTSSIRFLTLSSTYHHWALMTFKVGSTITSLCFNDILQTRISIDIRRQNSNMTLNRTTQEEIEIACNIYNIYCNTGNFFLPNYMELICHASEIEILGPLFEGYLPELYNLPISFLFPLPITEDGDVIQPLPSIVEGSNNPSSLIKKNVKQTYSKQLIQEWSVVLNKMNREIDSNRVEFTRNFKDCFKVFINLLNK